MGLLVIALGGVLSAIGATAIWFGWDIVNNERGWTQVISGSVGFSGGLVTIALGLVLMRLGGLRHDLNRFLNGRQALAPAERKQHEPPPEAEPPPASEQPPTLERSAIPGRKRRKDIAPRPEAPDEPAASVTAAFAPPLSPSVALAGAASTGMTSSEEQTPAAPETSVKPAEPDRADVEAPPSPPVVEAEAPQPLPGVEAEPPRPSVGADPELASRDEATGRPPGLSPAAPQAAGKPQEKPQGKPEDKGWLPRRKDEPFSYDRFEEELAKLDQVETAATVSRRPEPVLVEHAPVKEAKPAPAPAGSPKTAIVGQYEAGGVSYVMYADGSIEADTPSGLYRFVDINELKSFIQSQGST